MRHWNYFSSQDGSWKHVLSYYGGPGPSGFDHTTLSGGLFEAGLAMVGFQWLGYASFVRGKKTIRACFDDQLGRYIPHDFPWASDEIWEDVPNSPFDLGEFVIPPELVNPPYNPGNRVDWWGFFVPLEASEPMRWVHLAFVKGLFPHQSFYGDRLVKLLNDDLEVSFSRLVRGHTDATNKTQWTEIS